MKEIVKCVGLLYGNILFLKMTSFFQFNYLCRFPTSDFHTKNPITLSAFLEVGNPTWRSWIIVMRALSQELTGKHDYMKIKQFI